MKNLLIFLAFIVYLNNCCGQNSTIAYHKVDSLLNNPSTFDYLSAMDLLKGPLVKDSLHALYWAYYGRTCYLLYRNQAGDKAFEHAIKMEPHNGEVYFHKAKAVFYKDGDAAKALAIVNEAISLDPNGKFYFYQGIYYQVLDSMSRAEESYNKALLLHYKEAVLYRNLSILYLKSDKLIDALTEINQAIRMDSNDASNYHTRGQIYVFMLDPTRACPDFRKAMKAGNKAAEGYYANICENIKTSNPIMSTGDVLMLLKQYRYALGAYNKVVTEYKDSGRFYLNRGYCYYSLNNLDSALADYTKSMQFEKTMNVDGRYQLYENLCLYYFNKNNFLKAVEYADKSIQANPINPDGYINKGYAQTQATLYQEAMVNFNTAIGLNDKKFRAYAHRSFAELHLGKFKEAYIDAQKAISLEPKFDMAWMALGHAKRELKITGYCDDYVKAESLGNKEAAGALKAYCK